MSKKHNELPPLIGLAGRIGAGKDTVAALLMMRGYERVGFADALRTEVAGAIMTRFILEQEIPGVSLEELKAITVSQVWQKPTPPVVRRVLQWWGTDLRRRQSQSYWLDALQQKLKPRRRYAIADVRFPDEVEMIRKRGGEIWLIRGRSSDSAGGDHVSERHALLSDRVIDNGGAICDLAASVISVLDRERKLAA